MRFSRALKEAKLCLSYHKTSHGVSPGIQFTLWVVEVWSQANVYLENRILLPWFAKTLKHFMNKMLHFCLIVIGCFCQMMNDHPPLESIWKLRWNMLHQHGHEQVPSPPVTGIGTHKTYWHAKAVFERSIKSQIKRLCASPASTSRIPSYKSLVPSGSSLIPSGNASSSGTAASSGTWRTTNYYSQWTYI